ncbi:rCG37969 [Rattus norvegicus]|uniref:RCG37969 n=1 Tax=Rattus norvegicus TaxID=10116 RepID=A6K5R5_RAT|nr:rCG37969 [Rattus norvegicus]
MSIQHSLLPDPEKQH